MKKSSEKVAFKEVGRIQLSDTTALVVSEIRDGKSKQGYAVNPWITTDKYSGPTKGFKVPLGKGKEVIRLLQATLA